MPSKSYTFAYARNLAILEVLQKEQNLHHLCEQMDKA